MIPLLFIAALLACFDITAACLVPLYHNQPDSPGMDLPPPPADADEDIDALPFGPAPRSDQPLNT